MKKYKQIKFSQYLFNNIALSTLSIFFVFFSAVIIVFNIFNIEFFKNSLEKSTQESTTSINLVLNRFYEIGTALSYDPFFSDLIMDDTLSDEDLKKQLSAYFTRTVLAPAYLYSSGFSFTLIIRDKMPASRAFSETDNNLCTNNIVSSKAFENEGWYKDTIRNPLKSIHIN